jgi:hypothetical protein
VFKNSDWTGKAEFIIDETDPKNKELIEKVQKYAPYFAVIANSDGKVTNIVKTEDKPKQEEQQSHSVSTMDKIAQLETELARLKASIAKETEDQV